MAFSRVASIGGAALALTTSRVEKEDHAFQNRFVLIKRRTQIIGHFPC
jgi:hypothetical protein